MKLIILYDLSYMIFVLKTVFRSTALRKETELDQSDTVLSLYELILSDIRRYVYYILHSSLHNFRPGEVPALFYFFLYSQLLLRNRRAASLFGLYPVTGKFSFLVSSTYYKSFGSKSFILCEHFHI